MVKKISILLLLLSLFIKIDMAFSLSKEDKVSVEYDVYDKKKNIIQSIVFDGKLGEEIQAQFKNQNSFQCETKGVFTSSEVQLKKYFIVTMKFNCTINGTTQQTTVSRFMLPRQNYKKVIRKFIIHKDLPELWFKVKEINQ